MRRMLLLLAAAVLLMTAAAAADGGFPAAEEPGRVTLGVSGIAGPNPPADKDAPWSGSYVWFGAWEGRPIRFRVLAKDTTVYTEGKALFLDSDRALFDSTFDDEKPYSNSWHGSSLQKKLNGEFLAGFDGPEQAAVALSTGNGGISWPSDYPEDSWWGPPVSVHDRVFLLDHAEVRNEAYGYASDDGFDRTAETEGKRWHYAHPTRNRRKEGSRRTGCWLLRTASAENSENRGWHVLGVLPDGGFFTQSAADAGVYRGSGGAGIAPALNVDQAAVLFSTSVGENGFKLTLIDPDLSIAVPTGKTVSVDGRTVTVPNEIGGPAAGEETRAAVLILDREYTPGNENGAAILWHGAPDADGGFGLPGGCDPDGWGSTYFVYLLAENRNDTYETDYASQPAPLNPPGSLPAAGELRVPPEEDPAPAFEKNADNTGLGTAGIRNPAPGGEEGALWSGDCVYFGKYDGRPVRFRVLAKDETAYTAGKALFLDSDEALFVACLDGTEPISNAWAESDLRAFLNGPFLDGFAAPERAAVALSAGAGGRAFAPDEPAAGPFGAPVPVADRVFLPDVADVTNPAYGYAPGPGWKYIFLPGPGVPNHVKTGAFTYRWLRSAVADKPGCAADVNPAGVINELEADSPLGVAPALNLDQRAILFSTQTAPGEFKLTVLDDGLAIEIPQGKAIPASGDAFTIPWVIGGRAAGEETRPAVLILDREYTPENENGAAVLHYGLLDGAFTLPEGCGPEDWGTDCFVYLVAENRNGPHETDYASAPVPVAAP